MSRAYDLDPPQDIGEAETIGFDYGPGLGAGVAMAATAPVFNVIVSETSLVSDPNPQGCIVSAPVLVASKQTGAPNAQWNILFQPQVAGCIYVIQCLAYTNESTPQRFSIWVRDPTDQPS